MTILNYSYRHIGLLAMLLIIAAASSCKKGTEEKASNSGTFAMGTRVQLGQLVYSVFESRWYPELSTSATARLPKNRYLLIRLSVTNSGGQPLTVPVFNLVDASGNDHYELTEGVQDVPNWFGIIRTLEPAQTEVGTIIFDVPLGAYKLRLSDGGEITSEKTALINIPLQLE